MVSRMGVREFRDSFTTIARDATEPVIVTNHDKIVGWFTPAKRPPRSMGEILSGLEKIRRRVEARGVDLDARLKELGLDDETMSGKAPSRSRPAKPKRRGGARTAK